jgi:hypothetical protein
MDASSNSAPVQRRGDGNGYISREQWYGPMPVSMRRRWNEETDFDRHPPGPSLLADALAAIGAAEDTQPLS